jgi:hypothetical protein
LLAALAKDRNLDFHARTELDLAGNRPPELIGNEFIVDPLAEILTVAQPDEPPMMVRKPAAVCCERRIRDYDAKLSGVDREGSTEIANNVRTVRAIHAPMVLYLRGS